MNPIDYLVEVDAENTLQAMKRVNKNIRTHDIKEIHRQIDISWDYSNKEEKPAEEQPKCKRGCSFCCYLHVDISKREAEILAPHLTPARINELHRQKGIGFRHWQKLPYKSRKCVFLENGECSVYDDRPAACRKYYVATDPKICNSEFQDNTVGITFSPAAEVIAATLLLTEPAGNMADMLLRASGIEVDTPEDPTENLSRTLFKSLIHEI